MSTTWSAAHYVPNGQTCPFCEQPVEPQATSEHPSPTVVWRAAGGGGHEYAHAECLRTSDAHDETIAALRDVEQARATEEKAWNIARASTELAIRAERRFKELCERKVTKAA